LETSGIAQQIAASRMFPRPAVPPNGVTTSTADSGPGGAT
jgi:hypothetical protein